MKTNHPKIIFTCLASLLSLVCAWNVQAASGTWTSDASGNWSDTAKWNGGTVADGDTFTADFSTINITADRTVTLDAAHTLSVLKFGDIVLAADHNWTLSGANTLTLGTTPSINVLNQAATISSILAGTAFTKLGAGALTLNGSAVNTYTGTMAVNAGSLTEDFSNLGTPTDLVNPAVILAMGGGSLTINGKASTITSQTFASTTLNAGLNTITVVNGAGSTATNNLKAITQNAGGMVEFIGPATTNSAGNVAATGTITTTAVVGTGGLLAVSSIPYATVGLYDWAVSNSVAGPPTTIVGGSQISGFYTAISGGATVLSGTNYDVQGNAKSSSTSTLNDPSLRFNTATPVTFTVSGSSGTGKSYSIGGILVTPNVGANNVTFNNAGSSLTLQALGTQLMVWQNNTLGELIFNANGNSANNMIAGSGSHVQGGAGTVSFLGKNSYTGANYLNGGVLEIAANACLGSTANSSVYLNGGTLLGNYTGNLDNGTTAHPVALGNNGGGLAATAGNTLTVDGVVTNATGAGLGALTIGIPASSANSNVQGLLPGTGTIAGGQAVDTANATAVFASGKVLLNSGANTYTGGTIIQNAVLAFTTGSLGTGGITFNGGTLQWSSTTADVSSQTLTFNSGGATLDMNGNTVTLANPIGNGGSGALAITNTAGGGSLTFQGANTYTGGTIINGGTLLANNTSGSGTGPGNVTVASGAIFGGTGTVAGNVTWQDGSYGNLTPTAHLTVSGTVTLNGSGSGNTININATGLTSSGSPYTLLTASSITGNVNPTPGGTGVFASGYIGVVSKSGNILILTVTASGVSSTWTDAHHGTSDNWSDTLNWTTGVPSNAGDSATFGSGGTGNPVNLNVSETVGGIVFTNASSYTITGANTLTLDNNNSGASIAVNNGSANVINTSVSLSDNTLITAASGASLTLGGAVANTSGSKALTVKGSGTVILSHANTYGPSAGSVGTTLDSSSGTPTLQLADDAALGAGDVSASSSTIKAAAANLSVANNVGIAFGATVTANNNGNAFALSGVISGLGALSATGGGSLTLTANNTYSGGTTNTTGQLNINNGGSSSANSAIGTGPLIINGGTIDNTSAGDVTLLPAIAQNWNGDFAYAGSAHNLNLGSGTVTLSANRQVTVSANTLTIGGIISGSGFGLTKAGAGTLALNAANTFSGTTAISGGTLTLGASAALQNSMLDYSSGTLTFSGITAASLGGLTGTQPGQNLVLNNDASAAVTLTVGGGGASTNYYGNLSGTGSLTKTGAGILTLTNANYTGVTTIGAGNLAIYGGSFGSASSTFIVGAAGGVVSNATLNALSGFIGTSASQSGAHLTVNGNATATFATGVTIGSAANTAGNLTVNTTGNVGLGAVTINRDSGSAAANAAGGLIVNQGTVTATTVTIAQSGVGGRGADLNINGGSLTIGDSSSTGAFSINSTTGNGYVTMSGGSLTYLGTDGLLMTIGGGPSVLNIYGGTATLTGVTLNSTNGSAITSTMTMLGTNSTPPTLYLGSVGLVANQPGATVSVTLSNAVVGAMADWSSAAPITLSGNTTLKAADAAAVAHNITLSGVLSGNGGLTKTGNGTLVLSGANTYTNSTTVSAGILELDQPSLFTNSSVSVASGASLNLNFIGTNQVSALVTNGVSKAPGLYDNGTDPTFITGTGKILVVPVVTINPNPPIMGVSINGNVLSLSWPTNAGWTLQAQTNSLSTGLGTNWTDVLGSTSITATNLTMDPTKPTVFYRLKL